jgi:hypothetical protein
MPKKRFTEEQKRGIKPVIPPKSNCTKTIRYSRRLYRERNCIERSTYPLEVVEAVIDVALLRRKNTASRSNLPRAQNVTS